jgi:16S rRNA (cytosine967-C5)-methyltransferase
LRVNTLKVLPHQAGEDLRTPVAALLPPTEPTPRSPLGLRALEPFNVEAHPAFLNGLVEVQDEGSQLACLACEAAPGETVIDLCAGAGGKTLALAAAMANRGRLIASDADRARLSRLAPRAERAGASIVEPRLLDPGREPEALDDLRAAADLVLIDAPCSGTGTWRRNPEARWRLTQKRLDRLTALQSRLIDVAAALVRPGGRLTYVVCSLLPEEGPAQVDAFLARTPGWARASGDLTLTPLSHGTDGFFIARLSPMS